MECPNCKGKSWAYTSDLCIACDGGCSFTIIDDYGKKKTIPCFTCQGTGKDTDTCNMCGGSGTV